MDSDGPCRPVFSRRLPPGTDWILRMDQLRLGFPPRDASGPVARLVVGLGTIVIGLAVAAVVIFVVLPLVGIIVSAAVGGMLLALAGIVMMIPLILVAGTVLAFMARGNARKAGAFRTRANWR
jgi:hypothetical protein